MQRMGIQQQELDIKQVIMITENKKLVFENPQVSKVNMMGQNTFQVIGEPIIKDIETKPSINEDDIQTVMDQTGCTKEEATKTIEETNGDLAQAIMSLKKEELS